MKIALKYPQKFKKQHKKRTAKRTARNLTASQKSFIYTRNPIILPRGWVSFIRKIFRKFFKKKQVKCWFQVQPNRTISSKSKNSRMGKGVGTINRVAYYVKPYKPMLLFYNASPKRIMCIKNYIQARTSVYLYTKL